MPYALQNETKFFLAHRHAGSDITLSLRYTSCCLMDTASAFCGLHVELARNRPQDPKYMYILFVK